MGISRESPPIGADEPRKITDRHVDRLAKILGLLGSDYEGERATAAHMADRMVRAAGLTWFDVVAGRFAVDPEENTRRKKHKQEPPPYADAVARCFEADAQNDGKILTPWECGFLNGIRERVSLTERQQFFFDLIKEKCGLKV